MKKRLSVLLSLMLMFSVPCPALAQEAYTDETVSLQEEAVDKAAGSSASVTLDSGEEAVNGAVAEGKTDMADAPALELGKCYTFDYNGKFNADLTCGVISKQLYFKYTVPEDEFYNVKFKSTSLAESNIYLVDTNGKRLAGDSYLGNEASVKTDISLKAGTYYVEIELRHEYSTGYICFAKRGTEMTDPEYDTKETEHKSTENGLAGHLDMRVAPRLALGETYTFDYNNKYKASLYNEKTSNFYYYKYLVSEEGFYNVKFKSSSLAESNIFLVDSNGNRLAGDSYLGNEACVKNDISLAPGVYYVGIELRHEAAAGYIYFGKRGTSMKDPEYDPSQKENKNTEKNIVGSLDMINAPRLALGEEFSVDYRAKYDANLRNDEEDKTCYYKYLVEKDGIYKVRLASTTSEESNLYLVDSNGKQVAGESYVSNRAYEKNDLTLSSGVYFVAVNLRRQDSRAAVELSLVKEDKGSDKPSEPTGEKEFKITYEGIEVSQCKVPLPNSFVWSGNMKPIKLPDKKQISRVGYTFVGWFDKATGKKIKSITKKNGANLVLEARWKENKYKVTYKMIVPEPGFKLSERVKDKVKYGYESTPVTLLGKGVTATSMKAAGEYALTGWSTQKGATTAMYTAGAGNLRRLAGDTTKNKKIVLYPVWTKKK